MGGGVGGAPGMSDPMSNPSGSIKVKPRYEFVIVFTWKEPTPSDALRKVTEKQAPSSGGVGGGMMGGYGAPPMSGGGVPPQPPGPSGSSDAGSLRGFGKD